jgi:hypothetical protein
MHQPLDMRVGPLPSMHDSNGAANGDGANGSGTIMPGTLPSDYPGPLDPLAVDRMNAFDEARKQAMRDRLEAESKGFDSVFGQ